MFMTTRATIKDLEFLKTQVDESLWFYINLTIGQLIHLENVIAYYRGDKNADIKTSNAE
ncbi:MAG: hypothetical protein LC106_06925 [Burkholderiales bacterium]|nr:hypothetical protein [Burkholderiales bacterium]